MKALVVWPLRGIKLLLNILFAPVYGPFWFLSQLAKCLWGVARWPFERRINYQIARAIDAEQRSMAQEIVEERKTAAKRAREEDKKAVEQYWKQQRQQQHAARRQRVGRQKMGYRRKN